MPIISFVSPSIKNLFPSVLTRFQQLSPIQQKVSVVVGVVFALYAALKLWPRIRNYNMPKQIINLAKQQHLSSEAKNELSAVLSRSKFNSTGGTINLTHKGHPTFSDGDIDTFQAAVHSELNGFFTNNQQFFDNHHITLIIDSFSPGATYQQLLDRAESEFNDSPFKSTIMLEIARILGPYFNGQVVNGVELDPEFKNLTAEEIELLKLLEVKGEVKYAVEGFFQRIQVPILRKYIDRSLLV